MTARTPSPPAEESTASEAPDASTADYPVVGVDLGGTAIKAALFHGHSAVARLHRPTPVDGGPDAVVRAVVDTVAALGGAPRAVGVAVPGIVDEERGVARHSVNLGWRDLELAEILRRETGLPVALSHDIRAGALAEARLGAARGCQDALFVAVGTGVAGAALVDGRWLRAGGYAGELGHVPVRRPGLPCACGGSGCLETVVSSPAVARAYRERTGRAAAGAAEVVLALAAADPDAERVWAAMTDALADALAMTVGLLAPEVVVLGGGVSQAGALLVGPVAARLERLLTFQRRPRLLVAELGDQAGCVGAALRARDVSLHPTAGATA